MKYYTNNQLKGTTDLQGTATISLGEDITGKFSGKILKKGTEIVVSGRQYDTLMDVISYTENKTNFTLESINC